MCERGQRVAEFVGLLPPPEVLNQYPDEFRLAILEDFAARREVALAMAANETRDRDIAAHVASMNGKQAHEGNRLTTHHIIQGYLGQAVSLVCVAGGGWLMWWGASSGHDSVIAPASAVVAATVGAAVVQYAFRQRRDVKQDE